MRWPGPKHVIELKSTNLFWVRLCVTDIRGRPLRRTEFTQLFLQPRP